MEGGRRRGGRYQVSFICRDNTSLLPRLSTSQLYLCTVVQKSHLDANLAAMEILHYSMAGRSNLGVGGPAILLQYNSTPSHCSAPSSDFHQP